MRTRFAPLSVRKTYNDGIDAMDPSLHIAMIGSGAFIRA